MVRKEIPTIDTATATPAAAVTAAALAPAAPCQGEQHLQWQPQQPPKLEQPWLQPRLLILHSSYPNHLSPPLLLLLRAKASLRSTTGVCRVCNAMLSQPPASATCIAMTAAPSAAPPEPPGATACTAELPAVCLTADCRTSTSHYLRTQ
jgi:hypothetical protein